jgi:hypothetical protein
MVLGSVVDPDGDRHPGHADPDAVNPNRHPFHANDKVGKIYFFPENFSKLSKIQKI